MQNEPNEETIDLMELVRMLLSRWYIVAAAVVVIASLTAIYAYGMQDDVYTSQSSVLVDVTLEEQADAGDIALAQRLLDTYTEVAESNSTLSQLRDNLDLDYTNRQIRDMLSVSRGRGDSIILKFAVESRDPAEAALMANEIVDIIKDRAETSSVLYDLEILDTAEAPNNPSGPNRLLFMAIGIILGGMVGVFGVFTIEFLDKTIKTGKDIEKKLNLRVLGTIPEYEMEKEVDER